MLKKSPVSILCFGLLIALSTACNIDLGERGNGQIITEEFSDIGNFDKVVIAGSFEVVLRESNQPNLIVMTDENLMRLIEVENDNGTLEIRSKKKLRPSDDSKLIVEYTSLEQIEVAGAAALQAENTIKESELTINMSGAGEVDLAVDVNELEIDVSGAGAVQMKGYAKTQKISMSGAGGYDGEKLESEICSISISGVGGAKVYVTGELDASVSGVGGVTYRGNPEVINKNVSGLGSIDADDDDSM